MLYICYILQTFLLPASQVRLDIKPTSGYIQTTCQYFDYEAKQMPSHTLNKKTIKNINMVIESSLR